MSLGDLIANQLENLPSRNESKANQSNHQQPNSKKQNNGRDNSLKRSSRPRLTWLRQPHNEKACTNKCSACDEKMS